MEEIWSNDLRLVENVKVEVGGGTSYADIREQYSLYLIEVKYAVYSIRGSFLKYQCQDPETAYVGPPNTNCTTYSNPKATGYCYKTTFSAIGNAIWGIEEPATTMRTFAMVPHRRSRNDCFILS